MNQPEDMHTTHGPDPGTTGMRDVGHRTESAQSTIDRPGRTAGESPLVEVQSVRCWFPIRRGLLSRVAGYLHAVDDVSFTMTSGEILGLVGESGCGKSTLGRLILRLLRPSSGTVLFDGTDITTLRGDKLKGFRKRAQIIFQDPHASLNPRMAVGTAIREALMVHNIVPKDALQQRVGELLETVGLNAFHARRYPHEFSSGQRQRIGIARALAVEPDFVLCDEPVSALDVSIQAQILNLLFDLRDQFNLTYLFISHDLSVVRHVSDRIAVMYLGQLVEIGAAADVMNLPLHPYTAALIAAAPVPDPHRRRERLTLQGDVPNPVNVPPGCPFHPRCPQVFDSCRDTIPRAAEIVPGHMVRCLLYEQCRPEAGVTPAAATPLMPEHSDA